MRDREEQLASSGWNLYGALHYLMTKWSGVRLQEAQDEGEFPLITEEALADFVSRRGRPPEPFFSVDQPAGDAAASARRTQRRAVRRPRPAKDDAGVRPLATDDDRRAGPRPSPGMGVPWDGGDLDDVFCLKRTSPSGGGLHPVEVYPLVSGVDGVDAGLYHYSARDHSLELIEQLGPDEAVALATDFACGQRYFGSAHVTFVMTARFPRSHWKYRKQQKAYPVILMDAAHLSQTHYLVAAELGLGAYVTIAVNSVEIEERLSLDGIVEGVVAVAGCGKQRPEGSPFEPRFTPYVPRETEL